MDSISTADTFICADCGFDFGDLHASEVPARVRAIANDYTELMGLDEASLRRRPGDGVWSAVEYVAHVRDVLLVQRDRVLLALVEDEPEPFSMHVDARVGLAYYNDEPIDLLLMQFGMAAGLFADQYGRLTEEQLARTLIYNYPQRQARDLVWLGRHACHEMVHHLADARRSLSSQPEREAG